MGICEPSIAPITSGRTPILLNLFFTAISLSSFGYTIILSAISFKAFTTLRKESCRIDFPILKRSATDLYSIYA